MNVILKLLKKSPEELVKFMEDNNLQEVTLTDNEGRKAHIGLDLNRKKAA